MMLKPNSSTSVRERFNISRLAIKYSWLTISFWIAVTVAGLLAFSSLKYALFPDVTFPVVVVNASAPLTTALDTEAKLTIPLEERLRSLEGLEDVRSSTYPSQTVISLSFVAGRNLEESTRQVESALKQVKLVSTGSYKIIPLNLNESSAISYAIQSSTRNLTDLTQIAKSRIVPAIAKIPGVLKVVLLGDPTGPLPRQSPAANALPTQGATLVRFNGKNALAFQVIKRGTANTLEVVSQVEEQVQQLQSTLPKDLKLNLAATQAEYIRNATNSTIDALIEAIILSVVVIFPFLWNWRATLISALAIPTSLLGTFIVMAIFGFNLETITLLALALVIGIIVDDAIVDVENIMRHVENGEKPRIAALSATNEIGLTVTAATFTAVAVFLPIGLMGGVIGQFFKPFGITVSAAMLTSLLVARTLSPVLASYWLKPDKKHSSNEDHHRMLGIDSAYRHLLGWALNHRRIVIGLAVLSFAAGIGLIPLIPKGFIPKLDRGEFNIVYNSPLSPDRPNPLNDSLLVAQRLDDVVRKSPVVESVFTVVGSREGEPNKGTLYVKLKRDRSIKTAAFEDTLRLALPSIPGVTTSVEDIQFVDTGGQKPLQLALKGNDPQALGKAAKAIKAKLDTLPGFADVTVTGEANAAGTVFEIERQNNLRVAYVSANLGKNLSLGSATDQVKAITKTVLPPGVTLKLGGDSARIDEILKTFAPTIGLSILCIMLVLFWLFRSWIDPVVIGLSLPLALVGAMLALLLTGSEFGMISLIGFIFLLGLSNKNAILLVDYINKLRASGLSRTEAILKAAPVRLRPIIMTTAATILGMVPIALGLGAGSELRSPMAVAIAGGLVTSTLLSLLVVPVVYALLDDWFPRGNKGSG
jgi:multidrug efflux pump subunit AcrB